MTINLYIGALDLSPYVRLKRNNYLWLVDVLEDNMRDFNYLFEKHIVGRTPIIIVYDSSMLSPYCGGMAHNWGWDVNTNYQNAKFWVAVHDDLIINFQFMSNRQWETFKKFDSHSPL